MLVNVLASHRQSDLPQLQVQALPTPPVLVNVCLVRERGLQLSGRITWEGVKPLKKGISPAVAVVIIVVVVALVGWWGYSRMSGPGLSKDQQDRFLKPLELKGGGQLPAPPQPGGNLGIPGPGPGGGNVPMPPPPR